MEKKRTAKGDILLIAGIAAAGIIIAAAVLLFSPHGSEVVVTGDFVGEFLFRTVEA